jgi:spoIIIJ-associated protein
MEWVETTARTVEEAKELALDRLGVAEDDAEVIVVEEPKSGLFGRLRGEARVRARVRPTQARQKVDRRDRRKSSAERSERPANAEERPSEPATEPATEPAAAAGNGRRRGREPAESDAVKEAEVSAAAVGEQARIFVEQLVEAFGLRGETTLVEDGDDLEVRVDGADLGLLVGPRGATLQAVQDLARVASQRRLGDHSTRLLIDIGGYRVRRREALGRFAAEVAEDVQRTGASRALEPMSSADRKIVHEALAEVGGVSTRSEGEDPQRRVIIDPVTS